jgi:hypothetical protein
MVNEEGQSFIYIYSFDDRVKDARKVLLNPQSYSIT